MKYIFIILLSVTAILPKCIRAEVYIDVGLAMHSDYYDTSDHPENQSTVKMQNPLGIIEAGIQYSNTVIFFSHISSIPDGYDNGLNMIGIKYRFK